MFTLSQREIERTSVLRQVRDGILTAGQGAEQLGLSASAFPATQASLGTRGRPGCGSWTERAAIQPQEAG